MRQKAEWCIKKSGITKANGGNVLKYNQKSFTFTRIDARVGTILNHLLKSIYPISS
ncbi:hypothetical protein [Campylobacter helveticus]|nr:hypothetical protein [Campylobacter helveticus]